VGEIAKQTKARGGYLNAHTIYDHTSYYAVLPGVGFADGLDIQADAYAESVVDAASWPRSSRSSSRRPSASSTTRRR
jgi:zinc protease